MSLPILPQYTDHSRHWESNRFVYPVLSRRSHGISVGINLNPDKVCNFDCIYCQVNRRTTAETRFVETERLLVELNDMLQRITSGDLFEAETFASVPLGLRRLNDIAFSGDGEPTTYRNFDDIVSSVAACRTRHGLVDAKLVLITNASMFHRDTVRRGLEVLDHNNGEIWAKLDAGTDAYYQQIERTSIPFQRILDNITSAARQRPVVIQSLFMRINDEPPTSSEIDAFCGRLSDTVADGGQIRLVQIYTVARPPAETCVTSLSNAEVDAIVASVRSQTGLTTEAFYGRQHP